MLNSSSSSSLSSHSVKSKSKADSSSSSMAPTKSLSSAKGSADASPPLVANGSSPSHSTTKAAKASNLESTVDKINNNISSLTHQKASLLLKDKTKTLSDSTTLKLNQASQDVEMEESNGSNEKAVATCLKSTNDPPPPPSTIDHNNNSSTFSGQENGVAKLGSSNRVESMSIPLAHWPLQGSITTVNLTDSASNGYFLMHAPLDLISTSATLSQSSLSSLNGFVGATLNANALATPSSPPSCSSSINSSPNSTGGGSGNGGVKIVRDERRRANHNEVERRRRDNINKWIVELSKVIPDCSNDQSKHGQNSFQTLKSKGGILEKTVQYLCLLKDENQRLGDQAKLYERLQQENVLLNQQNEAILKENSLLRAKLTLNLNEDHRTAQEAATVKDD